MISIMESFFWTVEGFGEKTPKEAYTITDEFKPDTEINKDNLLIRDEGIGTAKNNYESQR